MIMLYKKHPYLTYTFLFLLVLVVIFPLPMYAGGISTTVAKMLNGFVTEVFGFFVALTGIALEWSFNELVFKMGTHLINDGVGTAIDQLWSMVRDLFNIAFIFGLIYIGFRTILFSEDSQAPRALGFLIAAALLINFSLFITKAIVDISNVTAYQVYSSISVDGTISFAPLGFNLAEAEGISAAVMQLLNLQSLFAASSLPDAPTGADSAPQFTFIFGMLIMFVITSFAFAAGAIMLMVRYVALVFFLILSPVMFLGWVIPKFSSYSATYWDMFLKHAFFAPAYTLALYMSIKVLKIMHDSTGLDSSGDFAKALKSGDGSQMAVILYFLVAIAFMIGSVIIGQKMGIAGSGTVINFGKGTANKLRGGAQRIAGGATFGLAGKIMQQTQGRRARTKLQDTDWVEKNSKTFLGRRKIALAQKSASSSFDVRNIAGVGNKIGVGQSKGSWDKSVEKQEKELREITKLLGTVDDDDPQIQQYQKDADDAQEKINDLKEQKRDEEDLDKKREIQEKIKIAEKELRKAKTNIKIERDRRISGSAKAHNNISEAKKKLEDEEELLKYMLENETTKSLSKKDRRATLKPFYEEVKKARKNLKEQEDNLGGFLTERANNSVFSSGKTAAYNLRKQAQKKRKKSEDEISTDKILDSLDKLKTD